MRCCPVLLRDPGSDYNRLTDAVLVSSVNLASQALLTVFWRDHAASLSTQVPLPDRFSTGSDD